MYPPETLNPVAKTISQIFRSIRVTASGAVEKINNDVSNCAVINTEILTPRTNENRPIAFKNNRCFGAEAFILELVDHLNLVAN